jgi:mannose-1-phosphate guanylyltransferase
MTKTSRQSSPWCLVIADDHGHEWAPVLDTHEGPSPVQYARLGGSTTLLQRALARATRVSPASQVMVTVLGEYREFWEPSLWFVRPEHRFVCEGRAESTLTASAAVLKIADASPSNVVIIAPARVHVLRESILAAALERALCALPSIPEGVLTLAMIDDACAVDEDYLVLDRPSIRSAALVLGVARRPNDWVANHLRLQGAMIASGVMIGYAGVFAAHISRQWPGLARMLNQAAHTATAVSAECEISSRLSSRISRPTLASLRWQAPTLRQRALCVDGCGWSGLRSARAVARTHDYLARLERIHSSRGCNAAPASSSVFDSERFTLI